MKTIYKRLVLYLITFSLVFTEFSLLIQAAEEPAEEILETAEDISEEVYSGTDPDITPEAADDSFNADIAQEGTEGSDSQKIPDADLALTAEAESTDFTAANVITSGSWEQLFYEITDDYVMTFSGDGDMPYIDSYVRPPWYEHVTYVKKIVIESGITSISRYAFAKCIWLEQIFIPDTVELVALDPFFYNISLTSIEVSNDNRYYTSYDDILYTKAMDQLIRCPINKSFSSNYILPSSLLTIHTYAFGNCINLTDITISKGVKNISERAFYNCQNLKSCYIPDGAINLERYLFYGCESLTEVRLPSDLESMPYYLFQGCKQLKTVEIPLSLVNDYWLSTFEDCETLETINIPYGTTSLFADVFKNCKALKNLEIPNSVNYIGTSVFSGCRNLESLFIPNSVTNIEFDAFTNCHKLTVSTYSGSYAERFCIENNIPYIVIDPTPAVPQNLKVSSTTYNSITISWDESADADGYQIYYSKSANGPFTRIKTTANNTYTHNNLGNQEKVYYKVEAYKKLNINYFSDFTNVVSATAVLERPEGVKASSVNYSYNSITWTEVPGATGYQICYSLEKDGVYTRFVMLPAGTSSYTHKNLTTGQSYYYKVRACKTVQNTEYYSFYSNIVTAKPKPATPTSSKAASASYNSIKVSWSKVSYATGYQVYYSESENGTYTLLTTTAADTISYVHNKLNYNQTYYYKIRTMQNVHGIKYYSAYTNVVSAETRLGRVTGLTLKKSGSSGINLAWEKVSGATGYQIYVSDTETGSYTLIETTTANNYTHSNLSTGTYFYKVRAYKSVNSVKTYGNLSEIKSIKL